MFDVSNIWHVPLLLEEQGAHKSICAALQLEGADQMSLGYWRQGLAERWDNLTAVVRFTADLHLLKIGQCIACMSLTTFQVTWSNSLLASLKVDKRPRLPAPYCVNSLLAHVTSKHLNPATAVHV